MTYFDFRKIKFSLSWWKRSHTNCSVNDCMVPGFLFVAETFRSFTP